MHKFKRWLNSEGMENGEIKDTFSAFRIIRDGKQPKDIAVSVKTAEKLLSILSKELEKEESKA